MTAIKIELLVINSRMQAFWFELVLCVNGEVLKSYGHYTTSDEAESDKKNYSIEINQ